MYRCITQIWIIYINTKSEIRLHIINIKQLQYSVSYKKIVNVYIILYISCFFFFMILLTEHTFSLSVIFCFFFLFINDLIRNDYNFETF